MDEQFDFITPQILFGGINKTKCLLETSDMVDKHHFFLENFKLRAKSVEPENIGYDRKTSFVSRKTSDLLLSHNQRSGSAETQCNKSHNALVHYRFLLPRFSILTL